MNYLQEIIDFAIENGFSLKYSPARRVVRFNHPNGLKIRAEVYKDPDLWINFDINSGMSGNDPACEFLYTLKLCVEMPESYI